MPYGSGQENGPAVEQRRPCETSRAPLSQIPDRPCPPHVDSFSQTPADRVLDGTSSSHLQSPQPTARCTPIAPRPTAPTDWQNAGMPHWEIHRPAESPLVERLHWVLQPWPFEAQLLRARCADRHGERSYASQWRRSFSWSFQKECATQRPIVDCIHFSVIAYVDGVYLWRHLAKGWCKMADGFIWYELVTNDIGKAVSFYRKVVGWDVKDAGMPGFTYMIFGKDGKDVGGMMTSAGAPDLPTQWMGHIHTGKLDEELKAVTADGGIIVKP